MPTLTWPSKNLLPVQPANISLDSVLYPQGQGYRDVTPLDRLFLGDNLPVMAALLPEFENRLDLI